MKNWTLSILFYIKKIKLLKTGVAPIYMRITEDGKRAETSINRSVFPGFGIIIIILMKI